MSGVLIGSMSEADWVKVFLWSTTRMIYQRVEQAFDDQALWDRFSGQSLNDISLVLEGMVSQPHEGPSAPRA
jgi:hypothetical protein